MDYYVEKIREDALRFVLPSRESVYRRMKNAVLSMYNFLHSRNSKSRMVEQLDEDFKNTVFQPVAKDFFYLDWLDVLSTSATEGTKREHAVRQGVMPALASLRAKFPERAPGMPRLLEERSKYSTYYEKRLKDWDEAFAAVTEELKTDDAFAHRIFSAIEKAKDIVYRK